MHELKAKLIDLGMSQKEASVYLAMLELGATSVQEIAKKAGVNRATTYVLLESLKRRGLMSSVERGKKTTFAAESPEHLLAKVEEEMRGAEEKKRNLENILPQFMGLFNAIEDKPKVRFFEGEEGIAAAREILMQASGEFLSFAAIDESALSMSKIQESQRLRLSRRMHGRCIVSVKPGCQVPVFDLRNWQIRSIPYASAPFTGELNIVEHKVAACVLKTKPIAFLVESREMSDLFRALFQMVWPTATPVDLPRQ